MNVSALGSNYAAPALRMAKSGVNKYMMFTFGDWTPYFSQVLCSKKANRGLVRSGDGFFSSVSTAYNRSQRASSRKIGLKGANPSFFQYIKSSAKSWGQEISAGAKTGIWGGAKGVFGGIGKRMPLVGTALALAMEIPNLYNAFFNKEGGVVTGSVETGKAALKLGAFAGGAAAGAAVGTFIFPGVGTVVGGLIGFLGSALGGIATSVVADKVLGKSFTEKAEEKMEKTQESQVESENITPQFGAMTAMSSEEKQRYEQIKAAYENYSSNPFA